LRVRSGDTIRILDGNGSVFEGILKDNTVENLDLISKSTYSSKLILIQALIKPQKAEILLQKSCEIGVSKILFVRMKRSVFTIDSYFKKRERFENILIDAIKQSHNLFLPKILFFNSIEKAISDLKGEKICFYEKCDNLYDFSDINFSEDVNFIIGPEGGITSDEVSFLGKNNFIFSSLSPNILRAETAAIYALSILNYTSNVKQG
jgi:16S rRNA (uracil1498-N3)-methyltransferase